MYTYDYNSYATNAAATSVAGGIASVIFAILGSIIGVAALVVAVIALWKIFKKAGKNGWEALIGGHDVFVLCEILNIKTIWSLWIILVMAACSIPFVGWFIAPIFLIIIFIWFGLRLAKAFGKSTVIGVLAGIPVTAPVALAIIAFSDAKYTKPSKEANRLFEI